MFNFQFKPRATDNWPHQYFTKQEVMCKCGCGGVPTYELMICLDKLRESYGRPIKISSGYRCLKHNITQGGVMDSAHTKGLAVDVKIAGKEAYHLIKCATELGFTGIGISQRGLPTARFIHLDIVKNGMMRPWVWSY